MKLRGSFPILKVTGNQDEKQFEINNPLITFGREKSSNKVCIDNKNISRNHFSILFDGEDYKIIDNNSTNGIILNGIKVKESVIKQGDIITIADLNFTFYD